MGLEKGREQTLAENVPHAWHVLPRTSQMLPPLYLTTAHGVVAVLISEKETRVSLEMKYLA